MKYMLLGIKKHVRIGFPEKNKKDNKSGLGTFSKSHEIGVSLRNTNNSRKKHLD